MKSVSQLTSLGNTGIMDIKSLPKGDFILLDVRTMLEFSRTGIKGARHIPIDQLHNFIAEIREWGKPVITYSSNGDRSKRASQLLQKAKIMVFDGGAKRELERVFTVSTTNFSLLN